MGGLKSLVWMQQGLCGGCGAKLGDGEKTFCAACLSPEGLQRLVDEAPESVRGFLQRLGEQEGVLPASVPKRD